MTQYFLRASLTIWIALSIGCASGSIRPLDPEVMDSAEDRPAAELLSRSISAHGGDTWVEVDDVKVSYRGTWGKLVPKMQPILSDTGFRSRSHEIYWPAAGRVMQEHQGPDGEKRVLRSSEAVSVGYRSHGATEFRAADNEQSSAAALVADAYSLFLFGPSFVAHRAQRLQVLPDDRLGGRWYSRLVADLEPGFGFSSSDQVVLWIDKESHRLFRVLFTLEGFEPAQGAEVDVTFESYRQQGGYWWPDQFRERVRAPVRAFAHAWSSEELVVNSGAQAPSPSWPFEEVQKSEAP